MADADPREPEPPDEPRRPQFRLPNDLPEAAGGDPDFYRTLLESIDEQSKAAFKANTDVRMVELKLQRISLFIGALLAFTVIFTAAWRFGEDDTVGGGMLLGAGVATMITSFIPDVIRSKDRKKDD